MSTKPMNVILVAIVGVIAGVAVLFSMNTIINSQLDARLSESNSDNAEHAVMLQMAKSLESIDQRFANIEKKINSIPTQPQQAQRQQPPAEDYDTVHDIPLDGVHFYGDKNAPITIVGFKDFECPFCARFHTPALEAVDKNPGKVKYAIKNFPLPFHQNAKSAAKYAMAAGEQGKYFEMAHLMLDNHRNLSEDNYKKWAGELGLNMKKLAADLKANGAAYDKIINDDLALGRKIGVRGTPTYFLNGKKTPARSLPQYQAEIDKLLK